MDKTSDTPVIAAQLSESISTLAATLIESIPRDKKDGLAYKIMAYIAKASVDRDEDGKVSTKKIHADLGNHKRGASAWLSPLWREIDNKHFPKIEESLIRRCRDQGFSHYPKIKKTGEDRSFYFIEACPIPADTDIDQPNGCQDFAKSGQQIVYEKDLSLQLSRLGKFFFGEGLAWTPKRRAGMLVWVASLVILSVLFAITGITSLAFITTPLSIRDLLTFGGCSFVVLKTFWHVDNLTSIFDQKFLVAHDWMIQWKERGATVEILKPIEGENHNRIHICRYTAKCPCGGMVMLSDGGKDFPGRIVGRCDDNPQEHIYTFDRTTFLGFALRESAYFPPKT